MKKRFISWVSLLLCLLLVFNISGCWNRRELNTLAIVLGLGIDEGQKPGETLLTAQIVKPSTLKVQGAAAKAFWNIQNSGETLFETLRSFTHQSNRKLYFPHIQALIISRDYAAHHGIQEAIDFFTRDHEPRLDVWILVAENKASDVLDTDPGLEKIPSTNLSKLLDTQKATSQTAAFRLDQFIPRLVSKTTAPIAPLVKIIDDGQKKSAIVEGTAVFKSDKFIGELNREETRGLLWGINKVKSGMINVTSSNDQKATLEILRSYAKITPELIDDKIIMNITVQEEGNLANQEGPDDLTSVQVIKELENKQSEVIKAEIEAALKKSKEYNADIFGFGEAIHKRYANEWKQMESNWDELYPNIEIHLNIETKLRRSGRITRSPSPKKE